MVIIIWRSVSSAVDTDVLLQKRLVISAVKSYEIIITAKLVTVNEQMSFIAKFFSQIKSHQRFINCRASVMKLTKPKGGTMHVQQGSSRVHYQMNSSHELIQIVTDYIENNFVNQNLCAIAAIHEGRNKNDPSKNNPHVHIIVPTRSVGTDGFSKKKNRDLDNKKNIVIWRKQWAAVQNRAYERNGLDIRVSHESLEVQGIKDREPTIHLSLSDWQKEKRGERTIAGDKKRAIKERNEECIRQCQLKQERELELEFLR